MNKTSLKYNIPEFYTGETLREKLTVIPEYTDKDRLLDAEQRLFLLNNLYDIYIPNVMSYEIYSKLYMALNRSMAKKLSRTAISQRYENYKCIRKQHYSNGLIGGCDSVLITGVSGIGKSSAIFNAIEIISSDIITTEETKVIPVLMIQCPFDCSIKSMLLEILRNVDNVLETTYYHYGLNSQATTDMLIGMVSQVALNHIGVLIIDEIQNVVTNKKGKSLVAAITQLINNSGTSIFMVGTPESAVFFESEEFLARRALGLRYNHVEYSEDFKIFVDTILKFNYTRKEIKTDEALYLWIYEHTKGLASNIIALIHDAQEIAIVRGEEQINITTLAVAYKERMSTLHYYISKDMNSIAPAVSKNLVKAPKIMKEVTNPLFTFSELTKNKKKDIITLLKDYIEVVEV